MPRAGHLSAIPQPRRNLVNCGGTRVGSTQLTEATLSPGLMSPYQRPGV